MKTQPPGGRGLPSDPTPLLETGGQAEDSSTRAPETAVREGAVGARGEFDRDAQDIDGGFSAQPSRSLEGGFEPGSDDLDLAVNDVPRAATTRTDELLSNKTGMWDADASLEDQVGDREEASVAAEKAGVTAQDVAGPTGGKRAGETKPSRPQDNSPPDTRATRRGRPLVPPRR